MDLTTVLAHVARINEYIALPEESAAGVKATIRAIAADPDFETRLREIEARVVSARDNDPAPLYALADTKGVGRDRFLLTAVELFSIGMERRFREMGWSEAVYLDSLLDITIWAKVCRDRTGEWGLLEYGWLFHAIVGQVVRLGRFQFERIAVSDEDDGLVIDGVTLRTGMPIVNVHIPEGDPITPDKRLDAYKRAYRFFGLTGRAVFTCHSWLLFEKHYGFLSPTSNVVGFMNDFRIVPADTVYGNGDMWRIFGTAWQDGMTDFDTLPQDTGLRRAYVGFFKNGGVAGMSKGFFVFDGEKIVREDENA